MKYTTIYILLFLSTITWSQKSDQFFLNWNDSEVKYSENILYKIPSFQQDNFIFDSGNRSIKFQVLIKMDAEVDESSVTINNFVYESISEPNLLQLDKDRITSDHKIMVVNTKSKDQNYLYIELSPIIKQDGIYKRVKSFTYNISNSSKKQSRQISNFPIHNSVLSTGDWYKFSVTKSGVYKLSKAFIESLGLNLNGVNPKKIKIFGNGGRMLPLLNSTDAYIDVQENAIQVFGEEDGVFDSSDYVLFYAEGVDNYNAESDTHLNLYSDKSYYYITVSGEDLGKRILPINEPSTAESVLITEFDDYQFYEKDLNNIGRMGRKWVGEQFNVQNQQSFQFSFPNLVESKPLEIRVIAATNAGNATNFTVRANNELLGTINFSSIGNLQEVAGKERALNTTYNATSDNLTIHLTYNNNGVPSVSGFLDYISITARRELKGFGKQFRFKNKEVVNQFGVGLYRIEQASQISQIWDITDVHNVKTKLNNSLQSVLTFKDYLGQEKLYIAVDHTDYFLPTKESPSKIPNLNIKGTILKNEQGVFTDVDYLIITPKSMMISANKLANLHRTHSGLSVKVVSLEDIYIEFGSGKQDIAAIRNLVKYVYNNASSSDKRIKYVALFGDASFDFKDRIPNNTNIAPIFHFYRPDPTSPYESSVNFSINTAFCSDDFFGLMDDNEGLMLSGSDMADIAVGRILANSPTQAEQMVNKIVEYYSSNSYGRWRNNITLIADDIDKSSDDSLQFKMEEAAQDIQQGRPVFNLNKIYLDAHLQETTSGGNRYPVVREKIINAFEQGSLLFNYLGHGGEDGLAHERVFEKVDGENLKNRYKYPLFITVTCEFTKFDNPYKPTAGEYVYWNPQGGAIAMITTTRTIGITTAENFNIKLSSILFSYDEFSGNDYPTIGEALRLAKNNSAVNSTRMVACVGDPALRLAIPKSEVVVTKINDIPVNEFTESLQALSPVKISGQILSNGNVVNDYNGEIAIQIFDKNITQNTLGNDNYQSGGQLLTMEFDVLGETIFRGNASVVNGNFELNFVVPRDIKIPVGEGKISFYAKRNSTLEDHAGYNTTVKIGGVNQNAPQDNIPPVVKLYMNDTSFISGGITNNSPILIAYLEDENGINTSSGIGHDIVAILDGNESKPYVLNDYYQTELDDFRKGKVSFPFRNLEPGLHTITFKAWDVYNNPVTAEIQFLVISDDGIKLDKVLNYPNPFVNYTEFWFNHNKPFEPLDVQIQVMTISGKVVWTHNQNIVTEGFTSRDIKWDGRDDFGDRLGKGVYIYKLTVKSTITGKKSEKIEKLVIL